MTHNSTRKQFFAKLLGVVTATSVLPKLFAKSAALPEMAPSTRAGSRSRGFELRHDTRAVARRDLS